MIVLDTHVIAELSKPKPSDALLTWFSKADMQGLFLSDTTVMELAYGAEKHRLKTGSNRYHIVLDQLVHFQFRDRILGWLPDTSIATGYIRARREMSGRQISAQDAQIAAICLHHGAMLATRNVRDFEGLDLRLVNPFEEP